MRSQILLALLCTSCSTWDATSVGAHPTAPEDVAAVEAECDLLVAASPPEWAEPWTSLQARGKALTRPLISALQRNPTGAGAQAAVHLLGTSGDSEACRDFLRELLADKTSLATEAALALGRLGDDSGKSSIPALRLAAADRTTPVTTRAAAAAALVDLGDGRSVAGLVEAIFLASSPASADSTREHGLPSQKTRWAHERYMLIEALRRRYDRTFGLDEDAAWPDLQQGAAAARAFLERG